MASKEGKTAPTNEELLANFDDLVIDDTTITSTARPATGNADPRAAPVQDVTEDDILAEFGSLTERSKSRPNTPRLGTPAAQVFPKHAAAATPPNGSSRTSEDKGPTLSRKSGDSTRTYHQSFTPGDSSTNDVDPEKKISAAPTSQSPSGGGWWGGLMATANAAVKQAEALAKEIQKNEEAQKWAGQVKDNVGALRGFGDELRSRALPTFSNILHTIAPPISSHERLQIHITHDFIGYPSLDPLIYQVFSRVMAQVEGGDLMVIQRGHESAPRRGSEAGFTASNPNGWGDGPWWRSTAEKRDLSTVKGLAEGTKLSKVSAESYATDYFASRGGIEEVVKTATDPPNEHNPVRSSDIFMSIQAISHIPTLDLFGGPPPQQHDPASVVDPADPPGSLVCFAVYLHDPIHSITFHTVSQTVPQKWIDWLDNDPSGSREEGGLPADIAEIVQSGGVDPREWVAEWVEEVLSLGVGVVAQRYVAKRMGVGEGGVGRGKGKARQEAIESGAGEAARAL